MSTRTSRVTRFALWRCPALAALLVCLLVAPAGVHAADKHVGQAIPGIEENSGDASETPRDDLEIARENRVHPRLLTALRKFGIGTLNPDEVESFMFLVSIIAAALAVGSLLAFHPCHLGKTQSLEAMDQPKTIITYTFIGALCGLLFAGDPSMGLVIFGIGGLMRFRTDVGAARDTGRVITATILGIFCGLEFWIPVIVGTAVAWLLILWLDWKIGVHMVIRGLRAERVRDAASAYREVLEAFPVRITQEKRNPKKGTVTFVMRADRKLDHDEVEFRCDDQIEEGLIGTVDWPKEG